MYRQVALGCVVLAALCLLSEAGIPTQKERIFEDVCENCIVSRGHGFSSFDDDCNCFVICNFVGSFKLSAMASPWVGSKRCCGCGASFARDLLTCVNFKSKKSDCFFGNSEATNPCDSLTAGDLIPRQDPEHYFGSLCSGFIRCVEVVNGSSTILVPEQDCCPDGQCFSTINDMCSAANCMDAANTLCNSKLVKDDCDCEVPEAEEKECGFMAVAGSPTEFMGVEMMATYTCPPGTCFDQDVCTCVTANNTGYTDCLAFLTTTFDGSGPANTSVNTTDGRGASVFSISEGGTLSGGSYSVNENAFLNVIGTAANEPGNNFVFRIMFTLEEDGTSSNTETQCILGNCLFAEESEQPFETDTIRVRIQRDGSAIGEEIELLFTYQDKYSMAGNNVMETSTLELEGEFQLDTQYTLWAIYCGDHGEETVGAVVYEGDEEGTVLNIATDAVENSQRLIMGQSGFLLGDCRSNEGFEGSFQMIEFYKCKLDGDEEYDAVFEDIFG